MTDVDRSLQSKMHKYSLKKRLVAILTITLNFLIGMLLLTNLSWVSYSNHKIAASNNRTIEYCVSQINDNLSKIDDALQGMAAANTDFRLLFNGASKLQAHVSSQNLINLLREYQRLYSFCDAFFVYSSPSGCYRDSFSSNYTYEQKQVIADWVRNTAETTNATYKDGWETHEIAGTNYLMRFYGARGTYLITLISFQSLSDIGIYSDQHAEIAFCLEDGSELYGSYPNIDFSQVLKQDGHTIAGKPKRMILHSKLDNTNVSLLLLIKQSGFLNELSAMQVSFLILSLYSVTLVPVTLHWVRRAVVQPLEGLESTIKEIRAGNLYATTPDCNVTEFQEVGTTFNEMMEQIRSLKLEAYERELSTQKAQQQYLQLQIRPHFYLNCLKGLYAIAEQKDVQKTQKFILSISRHLRYIFRDQSELVPLSQELEHIRHYIDIQQLTCAYPTECQIQVPETLMDFMIPPLTLSTFVENSCKHRPEGNTRTIIQVRATRLDNEEESYVVLTVEDNGNGFPEKILRELNMKEDQKIYTDHHVGIRNIRQRFRLIYGDSVLFAFYNTPQGPVSEVFIPLEKKRITRKETF